MTFVSVCLLNLCMDLSFLSPVLSTGSGVWMLMAMVSCPCLSWSISMKNSVRGWKGWALNLCPSRIYSARCLIWLNLKAQVSVNTSLSLVLFPILIILVLFPQMQIPSTYTLLSEYVCVCACVVFFRQDNPGWSEALPNGPHILWHLLQPGKIPGPWTERPICCAEGVKMHFVCVEYSEIISSWEAVRNIGPHARIFVYTICISQISSAFLRESCLYNFSMSSYSHNYMELL